MVTPEQHILFGPFSLDTVNECLWRGTEVVGLTPKMFAVLRYLLARPGQLVTKEELLGAVWSDTYVSDAALKVCIRRTREALNDNPKAPQFIETVQRRGYRFIGTVVSDQYPVANHQKKSNVTSPGSETRHHQSLIPNTQYPAPTLVGREAELTHLQHWLDKALGGERQVVFVTGEAGIGKTAVVESFLTRVGAGRDPSPRGDGLWVAWGECVEHYGAGEAYLPVLEALGRLCRHPRGARLFFLLNRYAPTWLAQMPWLVPEAEHGKLQQRIAGTTKERMLRELAELLEAVTAETPLIFVLEDLQWSDYSTLDCLAYLARRREPARLLLLGTYRPAEANEPGHPLEAIKQELLVHRYCQELPLPCLSEAAVAEYVRQRFRLSPASSPPAAAKDTAPPAAELHALAQIIHQRTDGNPLFLVNVLDYLVTHQAIAQANGRWVLQRDVKNIALGLPESLRQMMKKQVERLSHEDQRVLEAASVVGAEFTAAAVAAGVAQEVVQTEERCEDLARRAYFLQAHGAAEWPDGTVTARYRFIHNLYQDALYERVPAGKRAHLHRQIGERMEKGYGGQAHEVAAELAVHFERGREYGKAVRYLQQAAKNAIRRCGYREAVEHLNKGLTLLDTLPDTPERLRQEIAFNLLLGMSLIATKGYAAADVGAVYTRALALCGQGEETPQRYWALWGLQVFSLMRAELQRARELGEQLFQLAQRLQDPELLGVAHYVLGTTLTSLGELLLARTHLEQGIRLCDPLQHSRLRAACLSFVPRVLWGLGYPAQALQINREALALSQALAHPFTSVMTLCLAALLHIIRREWEDARNHAEAAATLADEHGFADWRAQAGVLQGYVAVYQGRGQEGILQMRQGLRAYHETGAALGRPLFLGLLADAYGQTAHIEEGLAVLADALAATRKNGQRLQEAWLHWRKGELLLAAARGARQTASFHASLLTAQRSAEESFHHALDISRRHSAKSLELRVATSLCRLWQQQGRREDARHMLAEIYGWFTEGFDTADLREAKALLDELAG